MPAKRLSMRQVREVLRLKWAGGLSDRRIAQSIRISRPTVAQYLQRAKLAGLSWPLPESLADQALERRLLAISYKTRPAQRPLPDWATVHQERKRKGVTLLLLWQEYKATEPDGLQYSSFCEAYRKWVGRLDLVMRQYHRAGETLFVDYAGQTMEVLPPKPVKSMPPPFSSRSLGPPTIPLSKPPGARISKTGSPRMCEPLKRSAGSLRFWYPTISRPPYWPHRHRQTPTKILPLSVIAHHLSKP
jgi:hypothetical protein